MNCPECGDPCDRVEVDIGVGIQCGPWYCYCGWPRESERPKTPGYYTTNSGLVISHESIRDRLDQFGLDGKAIVKEIFE